MAHVRTVEMLAFPNTSNNAATYEVSSRRFLVKALKEAALDVSLRCTIC
jgi:hypothetical protein